jgi:hypothetical protein
MAVFVNNLVKWNTTHKGVVLSPVDVDGNHVVGENITVVDGDRIVFERRVIAASDLSLLA